MRLSIDAIGAALRFRNSTDTVLARNADGTLKLGRTGVEHNEAFSIRVNLPCGWTRA
jgi:hypothetical protein